MAADTPAAQALQVLRFLTCGSVDDGKSTLIGRLLADSRNIYTDQLAALEQDSQRFGTTGPDIDYALLVDGLQAEREQGITIDVAHRYFSTARRSFIAIDTPGHEQYTRNMATGASHSDLAIILVDARKGFVTQTRRHSYICSLMGIREVVLAVNKMDLVDFDQAAFDRIVTSYASFASEMNFRNVTPIPMSARRGDNVMRRSDNMPWFSGRTLLDHLEEVDAADHLERLPFRFPVQWINRPDQDFRGLAGTVASGTIKVGDPIVILPSDHRSVVTRIITADGDFAEASAGDAVTLVLRDDIDVSRGDLLCEPQSPATMTNQFAAHMIWMDREPLLPGRQYHLRIGNNWTSATITKIKHCVNLTTFGHEAATHLDLNQIAQCNLSIARAIPIDAYSENRTTGAFILVDRESNVTAAAGMIDFPLRRASNLALEHFAVSKEDRRALLGQRAAVIWFTGLSGAGKSTIAKMLEGHLHQRGRLTYALDGDNVRQGLNKDLGFLPEDRVENIRRVGEVAKLFVDAGLIVLCSFISPFKAERQFVRDLLDSSEFIEVFVDTPLQECIRRDPKGLYAKVAAGKLTNFTGFDSPYEPPLDPEIVLDTAGRTPEEVTRELIEKLLVRFSIS